MKRALVTGANRGIGFAIAEGLSTKGYEVLLSSRNPDAGRRAATRIGSVPIQLDLASPDSISRAVKEMGPVDILVNNAGVLGSGGVLDDPDDFTESMNVMVIGQFLPMHHLTLHMVSQRYGRVVNVSSGRGAFSDGVAGPGAYGVVKAALNALTVSAARTLANTVKVNAMCQGWVRKRMGGAGASRSVEHGAETAIWLATLEESGPNGGFFQRQAFDRVVKLATQSFGVMPGAPTIIMEALVAKVLTRWLKQFDVIVTNRPLGAFFGPETMLTDLLEMLPWPDWKFGWKTVAPTRPTNRCAIRHRAISGKGKVNPIA